MTDTENKTLFLYLNVNCLMFNQIPYDGRILRTATAFHCRCLSRRDFIALLLNFVHCTQHTAVQFFCAMFNPNSIKRGPVLYKTYGRTDRRTALLHVVHKGKQSVSKFMLLN
jgi:hypothetical protein